MRKLLSVLIGLIILTVAGTVLWVARGPLSSETRTTGGILYTQSEIAAQGIQPGADIQPDLTVTTDEGPTSTNIVGGPEIADAALADLSNVDADESASAPETTADVGVAGVADVSLTTDVVLDDNTQVAVAPLDIQAPPPPPPDGQGGPTAGSYEQRVVELEWPSSFRVGGAGTVRITLKMLADGSLQPVAEIANNEVIATPILISDRYDTHFAIVTATLSAPDFSVEALNNASQTLDRGGELDWRWTLEAEDKAQGTVIAIGLTLTWQPRQAGGTMGTTTAIWGQTLQVDINHVFELITVPQASIAGTVLGVIGFIAEIPLLTTILETLWNIVFGRRDRDRQR